MATHLEIWGSHTHNFNGKVGNNLFFANVFKNVNIALLFPYFVKGYGLSMILLATPQEKVRPIENFKIISIQII